jgi:hypothetical protein
MPALPPVQSIHQGAKLFFLSKQNKVFYNPRLLSKEYKATVQPFNLQSDDNNLHKSLLLFISKGRKKDEKALEEKTNSVSNKF